ncbi:hypothetical protein B9Z55_026313 [Caenorhabditis nigoni]|uniref:Uncharacterized protein n=2 Tax=Caenorhabditis nigoni TaxID=1611254 RepID=A0A2G5T332_9PELO|nr:hypothetical protein B9Z55_026313 [Caenorhabditis nigoni]
MTTNTSDPKMLMSAEEIEVIEGKMKSLGTLLEHPRNELPELQPSIRNLCDFFSAFLMCKSLPYRPKDRQKFETGMTKIRLLEDLLIRVVLRGETVSGVLNERRRLAVNV